MPELNPLRIFVAMPGTDMGPNAKFENPDSVKENLLKPVATKLEAILERKVDLVIEKDKRQAGVIHASMFAEARDADVYIADLTGANPNVYLELGVRWALRDQITVPISQSVQDLRFNVFANRAILYYPDIIMKSIDDIVTAILDGLNSGECDSPVRLNSDLVTIPKPQLENLESEIERLRRARGEDLLHAAKATEKLDDRLQFLKQAVDANPASVEALLELSKTCRELGKYNEAIDALQTARRLAPDNAVVHRELGVTYSKQGEPKLAADSLREAVRLDPDDAEAWSNLGGALRRVGMADAPDRYDRAALEEAHTSYCRANVLNRFDLYAALNVARLDVLLSKWESERLDQAKKGFRKHLYLCRHMVEENPKDYWRRFDLAEALLFSGEYAESREAFTSAIETTPEEKRKDTLLSVLGPLRNYVIADVIQGALHREIERTIEGLEAAK